MTDNNSVQSENMGKKTITLEAIDPVEIYGAANKNLEALCGWFPSLKVVARGNDIILEGEDSDIEEFTVKVNMLVERRLMPLWSASSSTETR